jgi:thiol peroxidase
MSMQERTGEAFEEGVLLTVVGRKLQPSDAAPDFALENFDPVTNAMTTVTLEDSAGKARLLNIINSLDTPVCHIETQRWEQSLSDIPGVQLYTISMDLPFGMARWQKDADVGHVMLSAHNSEQFAVDYGVLLKEWRLLQRAVIVIDGAGKVVHAEYVADQMREPDYAAAIEAARAAATA